MDMLRTYDISVQVLILMGSGVRGELWAVVALALALSLTHTLMHVQLHLLGLFLFIVFFPLNLYM